MARSEQTIRLEEALAIAVASLREGEVVSFGDVAARCGRPEAARAAGAFLARTKLTLPWWRVVYADGRLPPCHPEVQSAHLDAEGVVVRGGKVVHSPRGRFAD